ncbi:amino acid adenylation domain-containing protein [Streptomyces fradiae]|uniref:non-ribosomal peptide synthetase n=1 Tax=Streptomyces fradiae TaxID=1906 RepID=UPI003515E496
MASRTSDHPSEIFARTPAVSSEPNGEASGDRPDRLPVARAQRALWLLDRLHPGRPLYNVPFAVRLRGHLDVPALDRALSRVAERHEVLRTVFPEHAGEPYAQVLTDPTVPLVQVDLRDLPLAAREEEALATLRGWADAPFDLAGGRLFRAGLLRLADDEHLLGLFLHHIVCDGPSVHVLFEELGAFYAGKEELPPLPLQFTDYAERQGDGAPDPAALDWWQEHLDGAPTRLALPTDRPAPGRRSGRGDTHTVRLPRELVEAGAALGRSLRTTPFTVMTAAYAALLGRLTGATDLLIGTPVTGRTEEEYEPLIGFFVNTVPLRIDLSGDPDFRELVRRVRSATLASVTHAGVPFEALVDRMRVERDPGTVPLVQAMLTFESRPLAEPDFPGLASELLPLLPSAAKFDLDVMIVRAPDGSGDYDLSLTYNTDLFEAGTVEAFARRFHRLLDAGAHDPGLPLHRLPLLTPEEERAAAEVWNPARTPRDPDALVPVHDWVRRHAATSPDAPAVTSAAGTLTYAELDRAAERLAHGLTREGVRPGDVVGILLPRGADLVTALLGVLGSGAAYLPLDLTHPAGHLRRILAAAGVRHVLTDGASAPRLEQTGARVLDVHETGASGRREQRDEPAPLPHPDALAYVLFTSGSTGEPKGVGVPHRALANHAAAIRHAYRLQAGDRVLQFANVAFDVAAEELFPTWAAGACAVLCEQPPVPEDLTRLLDEHAVTVANLPSSYWQRWDAAIDGGASPQARALRLLVVGSEPVDPSALRGWQARGGAPVVNAYGLTETTITSLAHEVPAPFADTVVPVGTPIGGVRAYVLDDGLGQLPPGVPGELYVGGAGLARGYLDRPGATAERFLPDPFSPEPGARMHRTGDLARRRPSGGIEVLGRIDTQLKVRGYRIEPGEVEAALCGHPDVVQAAVAARPGADGVVRLTAYVVTRSGAVPPDLREQLTGRLPAHLVPGSLTALPALPLLPSGKVDRSALPEPVAPAPHAGAGAAPGTDLERLLCGIWQEVLGLDEVGVHENFFDLGGTSYGLAAVHVRLREHSGGRLPLVALYEYPTIAALARHLADTADGAGPEGQTPAGSATGSPAPEGPRAAAPQNTALSAGRDRLRRRRLQQQ